LLPVIAELHDRLRGTLREREGREPKPTAGVIDAQSVRATATVPAASRGHDGGKKVTDTLGLLLVVALTATGRPRPVRTSLCLQRCMPGGTGRRCRKRLDRGCNRGVAADRWWSPLR